MKYKEINKILFVVLIVLLVIYFYLNLMTIKEGIESNKSNESNEVDKNNKLWQEQQKLIRNTIKTLDGEIIQEKESNNLKKIIVKLKHRKKKGI